MRKSGYRSYHGRMSGGKRVAIIVMVAVLVLAAGYLVSQHFMVYDDAENDDVKVLQCAHSILIDRNF